MLLAWMGRQDFARLAAGEPGVPANSRRSRGVRGAKPSLLRQVELIVIDSHRRLFAARGEPWSEPIAYRWLHYEDPMPVARLADGVRSLLSEGATVDAEAVDKACVEARRWGFSN